MPAYTWSMKSPQDRFNHYFCEQIEKGIKYYKRNEEWYKEEEKIYLPLLKEQMGKAFELSEWETEALSIFDVMKYSDIIIAE